MLTTEKTSRQISNTVTGNVRITRQTELYPVSVATFGAPAQPTERLMSLQSGLYRLIVALSRISQGGKEDSCRQELATTAVARSFQR